MKKIFAIAALSLIFISCTTNKTERDINTYISKNIMADAQSVIMETTREDITPDKIKITDMFGDAQNPFTGKNILEIMYHIHIIAYANFVLH